MMGKTLSSLIYKDSSDDGTETDCDEDGGLGDDNNYTFEEGAARQKLSTLERNQHKRFLEFNHSTRPVASARVDFKAKRRRNCKSVTDRFNPSDVIKEKDTRSGNKTEAVIHSVQGFQLKLPKLVLTRCDHLLKTNSTHHATYPGGAGNKTEIKNQDGGLSRRRERHGHYGNDKSSQYIQTIVPEKGRGQSYSKGMYRCQLCHRLFSVIGNALRHVKTVHLKEKKFGCPSCPKRFGQKQGLDNHFLIHSGLTPYKCTLCSKAFSFQSNLRRHMLFHSGIKPHKCESCPRSYILRQDLVKHVNSVHKNKNQDPFSNENPVL